VRALLVQRPTPVALTLPSPASGRGERRGALALSFGASAADKASAPQPTKEQQEMMAAYQRMAEVRQEHRQLDYFVGDWTSSTTMWMDSKTPPQKSAGKVHTQAIFGGR